MVTPQTLLHKYKCLWSVKGKSQGSSIQERILHTYTLRLGYNKNSILYQKTKTKTYYKECQPATKPRPKIHALIRLSYPSPNIWTIKIKYITSYIYGKPMIHS